jgi:4-aminobutyrate aminotransferase/(S)-3-amino-2-methylpropionate transaminase
MDAVHPGGLGGTYGGNPVACAAALGAMQSMEEQDLNSRARQIESLMLPRLRALAATDPRIGEIRGRGAMLAIEIVKAGTKDPDPALTSAVAKYCHGHGVVLLTAGTYSNVIRFLPPLTIPDELLTEGLDVVAEAFAAN